MNPTSFTISYHSPTRPFNKRSELGFCNDTAQCDSVKPSSFSHPWMNTFGFVLNCSILVWRASVMTQQVKSPPTVQETQVQSLVWEDPLEKEMATHSSTLAWEVPWTEEPGGLQSVGSQRVRHDWMTEHAYIHVLVWGLIEYTKPLLLLFLAFPIIFSDY